MLVGFHAVNSNARCGICLETLSNTRAIAHNGLNGKKTPLA